MFPLPYIDVDALSGIMGSISIACWVIVFSPQLYENFIRQSADGLSLTFVVLWLIGDIFNIIGAILQGVLPTMITLAVYYTLADIVLLIQCIVYNKRNASPIDAKHLSPATPLLEEEFTSYPSYNGTDDDDGRSGQVVEPAGWRQFLLNLIIVLSVVLAGVLGWVFSASGTGGNNGDKTPHDKPDQKLDFWGQVFGYLCAVLYLGSRVPQILLNYKRKSVDGISFLFFLFACLGNLTYVISIIVKDQSRQYLIINFSWLLGSLGTLGLDFTIFVQFWIYNGSKEWDSESESESDEAIED